MLYIIVIYASSQNGLVFYINQKVLGIRYFQRSCASYYHHIWVISTYRISIWSCIYVYMISSIKKHIWKMVLYICIYDIINRKTYLKTLYLIPNTFKEWAENFKSLPQYCPVMNFGEELWGSNCYLTFKIEIAQGIMRCFKTGHITIYIKLEI